MKLTSVLFYSRTPGNELPEVPAYLVRSTKSFTHQIRSFMYARGCALATTVSPPRMRVREIAYNLC